MKLLFFLDIDGTLILEDQKPNTKKLQQFIKNFKDNKNVLFGLNSNRSIEDLRPIYEEFNLNGPVIVENGICFRKRINGKIFFLANIFFNSLPKIIEKELKSFCKSYKEPVYFKVVDTVKALKTVRKKSGKIILMNKFRKYTASIHVFNNRKRDGRFAKEIKEYLEEKIDCKKMNLEIKMSEVFSNILVQTSLIDKGRALKKMRQFYPDYEFIMIGDDEGDLNAINNVDYIAAVSNAVPKLKKIANMIAKKSYTQGVLEIVEYYLKNNRV